jgi:transcriptional regulator with XRE-family HTH domain
VPPRTPFWPKEILKQIRQLREDRGLSQDACATPLGLSDKTQYGKRESGAVDFSWEEIQRLRTILSAPEPWPLVSFADAYELERINQRRRTLEQPQVVAEESPPQRLIEWLVRRKARIPSQLEECAMAEMTKLLRFSHDAAWTDDELDDASMIALRRCLAMSAPMPPPPAPRKRRN